MSRLYGFPVWLCQPGEKFDLQEHAAALRAEDALHRSATKMTANELYDAVLLATGSKRQAEEVMAARIEAEIQAGLKPSA